LLSGGHRSLLLFLPALQLGVALRGLIALLLHAFLFAMAAIESRKTLKITLQWL
jgi:hypothetical protein